MDRPHRRPRRSPRGAPGRGHPAPARRCSPWSWSGELPFAARHPRPRHPGHARTRSTCARLDVGDNEYGGPFLLDLLGKHLLVVGASGAGKGSLLWNPLRAMGPMIRDGLVRVHGDRPEGRRRDRTRPTPCSTAAPPPATDALDLLTDFRDRMRRPAGVDARHAGSAPARSPRETPFELLVIDELAMLTAYGDRSDVREALRLLAEILTQGRAARLHGRRATSRNRPRTSSTCGTCSPPASASASPPPPTSTWCSATAPATAARWPTRSPATPARRDRVRHRPDHPAPGPVPRRLRHRPRHRRTGHHLPTRPPSPADVIDLPTAPRDDGAAMATTGGWRDVGASPPGRSPPGCKITLAARRSPSAPSGGCCGAGSGDIRARLPRRRASLSCT